MDFEVSGARRAPRACDVMLVLMPVQLFSMIVGPSKLRLLYYRVYDGENRFDERCMQRLARKHIKPQHTSHIAYVLFSILLNALFQSTYELILTLASTQVMSWLWSKRCR